MEAWTLTPPRRRPLAPSPASLAGEPDERLVSLVRQHESDAFEALYARYRRELLGYCHRILRSEQDAEDVLQEVFAAAYRTMMADERPIHCRPWLYRITHNFCLNSIRRRTSTEPLPAEGDAGVAQRRELPSNVAIAEEFEGKETFRRLVADIQALPEAQRTALVLREVEGRSYGQIADATGASVASVRSLLLRARQTLAETVEARELPCAQIASDLQEASASGVRPGGLARRHVKDCERCALVSAGLKRGPLHKVAAILPIGPLIALKKLTLTKLGIATAGGPASGTAAGAAAGVSASSGTTAGLGTALSGMGGLAVKAGIGLAAAAVAGVGTVEIQHNAVSPPHRAPHAAVRQVVLAPASSASAGLPAPPASSGRIAPQPATARPLTGPPPSSGQARAGGGGRGSGSPAGSHPGSASPGSPAPPAQPRLAIPAQRPVWMPGAGTVTERGRPAPHSGGLTRRTRPGPRPSAPSVPPPGSVTPVQSPGPGSPASPPGSGTPALPPGLVSPVPPGPGPAARPPRAGASQPLTGSAPPPPAP